MIAWTLTAWAQGFDATGYPAPPDSPGVGDPSSTWAGRSAAPGAISVTLEGAANPLVREVRDGPYVRAEPVLSTVFGGTLGAMWGRGRFAGAVTLPLWVATDDTSTQAGLGDVRLWGVASLTRSHRPVGVSLVPFVRLPTGARKLYLGDPFGGGLLVSSSLNVGPLVVTGETGLEAGLSTGSDDWPGGVRALYAGSMGLASDRFGAHLEVRGRAPLSGDVISFPSEGLLTLKGRLTDRLALSATGGAALTRGPGAGAPRIGVGVSYSLAPKGVDPEEITPPEVETQEVYVVDHQGFPVHDVVLTVGNLEVRTSPDGFADVPLKAWRRLGAVHVEHPAYISQDLTDLDEAAAWWHIVLARKPVPVAVSVVGPTGEPLLTGAVELRSTAEPPLPLPDPRIDALGVHHWDLAPGSGWVAVITGDRMGGQARVIDIPPERIEPIRVDVVLAWAEDPTTELTIAVVDGAGDPVEDAAVAVENRDFGTTGPGGELSIQGLPRGEHAVTVRSATYGDARVADVTVGDDSTVKVTLDWPPGAVLTKARDTDGKPLDATVTFQGPASLPARTLGSDGAALFVLRPGTWTLTIAREGLAAQQRRVEVSEEPGVRRTIEVTLLPTPSGPAEVTVRVSGPDGERMADVAVTLDGKEVGRTGPDGTLTLLDQASGQHTVAASGPLLKPREQPVALQPGNQVVEMTVEHIPGVVDVAVPAGETRANVAVRGEHPVAPTRTDATGNARLVLPPGRWTLEVELDGTTETREVEVADDEEPVLFTFHGAEPPPPPVVTLQATRDGAAVPSTVTVRSSEGAVVALQTDGPTPVPLQPGRFVAVVIDDEGEATEVPFEVKPGTRAVELPLRPAADDVVTVVFTAEDASGKPLADAPVRVGGTEVGRTSAAGTYTLEAPAPGLEVVVESGNEKVVIPDASTADGTTWVATAAARDVPVTVEGATGPVQIAVAGTDQRTEVPADGTGTLTLAPGTWTVTTEVDGQRASATITVPRTGEVPTTVLAPIPIQSRPEGDRVVLPSSILFDLDVAATRPDAEAVLDDLARLLEVDRTLALIEVAGHTDDQGGVVYNQALSERRAETVRNALIRRGVEPERLVRRGYGLSRPVATGEEGRERNRRVEITILERTSAP